MNLNVKFSGTNQKFNSSMSDNKTTFGVGYDDDNGFKGTEEEWLESLKGDPMNLNVKFSGTNQKFNYSMSGDKTTFGVGYDDTNPVSGPPGASAYEVAIENGFKGTEEEWLESLKGDPGHVPIKGVDYYTEAERQALTADIVEQIKNDVKAARIGVVNLLASAWQGDDNLYSQVVNIEGVTENSQVDLTPDVQQLAVFYNKDLSFVTENEGGVVTVYAIGQKPTNDYTIQVTITEVRV